MESLDVNMNEEAIKKLNAANEFYKYIESGKSDKIIYPRVPKKKIPEHRVCSRQRKAVIHE